MTHQRLRETLNYIARVHFQAAECCGDSASALDERRRLLADFFRQREERLGQCLRSLQSGGQTAVLETCVQYVPTEDVDKALGALRAAGDQGASTTLKKCLRLQEEVIRLVRQLADNLNMPPVREVLHELAASEEEATKELALADVTQQDI